MNDRTTPDQCPSLQDFEFLAWMRRACFFRDDMSAKLSGLGLQPDVISALTSADAFRQANVVALYQDSTHPSYLAGFDLMVRSCWEDYLRACDATEDLSAGVTEKARQLLVKTFRIEMAERGSEAQRGTTVDSLSLAVGWAIAKGLSSTESLSFAQDVTFTQ